MPFQPSHDIGAARRWRKGESGNPKGRSKLDFDLAQAARARPPAMLQVAVDIALDESMPPESRLRAVDIILNRGHGRPIAPHVIAASVAHADVTQVFVAALREHNDRLGVVDNATLEPAFSPAAE